MKTGFECWRDQRYFVCIFRAMEFPLNCQKRKRKNFQCSLYCCILLRSFQQFGKCMVDLNLLISATHNGNSKTISFSFR